MKAEITKKIEELKQLFSDNTTMVTIEITAHETSISTKECSAERLNGSIISMRNVKGKFIK